MVADLACHDTVLSQGLPPSKVDKPVHVITLPLDRIEGSNDGHRVTKPQALSVYGVSEEY